MLNSGYGLCVRLCDGPKNRSLFAKCKRVGDDVVVDMNCPTPFIVATPDSDTSWLWGHYFGSLDEAIDYLRKGEV